MGVGRGDEGVAGELGVLFPPAPDAEAPGDLQGVEGDAGRHEPQLADDAEPRPVDVGGYGQAPQGVDLFDELFQGDGRRADEEPLVEALHVPVLRDDGLEPENLFVVEPLEAVIDVVLEEREGREILKQHQDVDLFPGGHLHAGDDGQGLSPGGIHHEADVLGRVVVAHADDVEALEHGLLHDGAGVHVEVSAGGKAGVHVEVAAEDSEHRVTSHKAGGLGGRLTRSR